LSEKFFYNLTGKPTNASYTLLGLSEKFFYNLTGKPTNASYTLFGLLTKDFSELIGRPSNSSYTLTGLFEKNWASLANKPSTIADYGITDLASETALNTHAESNFAHGCLSVASTSAIPGNASFTITGLSEKVFANLTGKPTSASYTLNGLNTKDFSELDGKPTNASYTLSGLSEKDYSSLTNRPSDIAGYGISDAASMTALNNHVASNATHNCTSIASYTAFNDHNATYTTHAVARMVDQSTFTDDTLEWPWHDNGRFWKVATYTDTAMRNRRDFGMEVFNGKLWIVGGYNSPATQTTSVWYSTDGYTWTIATTTPAFGPRFACKTAVFDNKMWMIGGFGFDGSTTPKKDSWYSTDGITWTLATSTLNFYDYPTGSTHFSCSVYDNKMWLYGKSGYTVYNTSDGLSWTTVTASDSFPSSSWAEGTTFQNKLWVWSWVYDGDWKIAAYNSTDGITWITATTSTGIPVDTTDGFRICKYDDKVWLVTGDVGISDPGIKIWRSNDGITWGLATGSAIGGVNVIQPDGGFVGFNGKLNLYPGYVDPINATTTFYQTW
jgi:hypothetical protein